MPVDQPARIAQQLLNDMATALVAQLVELPLTPTAGALRCPVTDATVHPRLHHVHGPVDDVVALVTQLVGLVGRLAAHQGAVRLYATSCRLYPVHSNQRRHPGQEVHMVELSCGWAVRLPTGEIAPLGA